MRIRSVFGAALLCAVCGGNSFGQVTWVVGGGSWGTGTNWSTGVMPVSTDDVFFGNAGPFSSTVAANFTVHSLTISNLGGALVLGDSGGAILTVTSAFTDNNSANDSVSVPLQGTMTLNVGGTGTLTLSGTNNTYSGYTYLSSGGLADGNANAFSSNSTAFVEVGSGSTLTVNFNETIAGLGNYAGGGSVVINNGSTLAMNGGYSSTFSGVISGNGNLEKDVTGQLVLTGANTYTGTTVISGLGTTQIQLGDGTTVGSLATSGVSGNGTLDFDEPSAITFSAPLTGALQVVQAGPGTVTLSGTNTNSGGFIIQSGGTLKAGAGATSAFGGATGLSTVTINGTGVLDLNSQSNTIGSLSSFSSSSSVLLGGATLTLAGPGASSQFAGTISGSGAISSSAYQEKFTGSNTYTGGTLITGGTLLADNASGSATGTGNIAISFGGALQFGNSGDTSGSIDATAILTDNGTVDFSRGDSVTLPNAIHGTGGVGQFFNGTTTLSGINTYSGTTEVFWGTLKAGSTSAFGGASGLGLVLLDGWSLDPGILDLNGFDNTVGGLSGTAGNFITLGNRTLTVAGSYASTFSGVIQGTGGNLAITGAGTDLVLDGANTYSGTTSIVSGATVSIGDGTALGASLASSVVNNGTLTFAPGLTDASSYPGIISGTGRVTVQGANNGTNIGSILLGTANTYTGGTDVISGELFVGNSTTGAPGSVVSGPVGTGTLTFEDGTEFSPTANVTLANAIAFNGTVDNDDGGANSMTLSGLVSGSGTYSWCTWGALNILGSANTFSGTVDMREGYLYLGSDTALGTSSVILDGGTSIDAFGSGMTRAVPNAILVTGSTAQIGNGNNNNLTFSGSIGSYDQATVITIDNGSSGSTTFSGPNSIYGATFVSNNAGTVYAASSSAFGAATNNLTLSGGSTLNVLGGITIQNPITIGAGANTLAGSGTIMNGGVALPVTNNVILSPSASPGGGPGDLTFTTPLVFVGGAIHFQLYDAAGSAGMGWGLITANGGIDLSGATANSITFNVVSANSTGGSAPTLNFNPASSYSWTFANASSITGFNAADFNIITSGFTNSTGGGSFSVSEVGNNLDLNFTPVPEPSTWVLMGAGTLALGFAALRRRCVARA